jgi:putative endonuclease
VTRALGRFGEAWAVGVLHRLGYQVIDRNVRFRSGELDIVAREGGDVVFVEVKCRRSSAYGSPEESISVRRFTRLATAANEYIGRHDLQGCSVRLDLMAIEVGADGRVARHNLIRGIESPQRG